MNCKLLLTCHVSFYRVHCSDPLVVRIIITLVGNLSHGQVALLTVDIKAWQKRTIIPILKSPKNCMNLHCTPKVSPKDKIFFGLPLDLTVNSWPPYTCISIHPILFSFSLHMTKPPQPVSIQIAGYFHGGSLKHQTTSKKFVKESDPHTNIRNVCEHYIKCITFFIFSGQNIRKCWISRTSWISRKFQDNFFPGIQEHWEACVWHISIQTRQFSCLRQARYETIDPSPQFWLYNR